MSRERELSENTLIITIGRISTQFVSFLLLPLYTALLSTEEYGAVDLVTTLVSLIIPVTSLMVDQGVFRYLLNCSSEEERKKTITSAAGVLTISSIISIVCYFAINFFIHNEYKIWLLLILLITAYSNLFLQIARGLKKTADYALGSFVCSASTIILNVVFIAALHRGAIGMLIATFIGNCLCSIFLFFRLEIKQYINILYFEKQVALDELRYSIPLIPNQLSIWIMNSSDRLIVSFFLGISANGILAVSHKFPAIYLTFFNIFLLAWQETGAIHYFDEDRDVFFTDMFRKMLSIFSTLCMAIIVVLPIVFSWFVNGNYHEAYYNIPIYLIASLFNVVVGLLGVVYVATKKTAEIAKTTMLAAAINIVAHLVLINIIGLYAASVSTFVGYGITMIIRIIDTKKYLKIKYDVRQYVVISVALALCSYIYYLENITVSIIFLPILLAAAYFFNKDTVNSAIKTIDEKIDGKINKKLFVAIIVFVTVAVMAFGGFYVYKKIANNPKAIQSEYKEDVTEVNVENVISFSSFGSEDFTCTGLSYDIKDDAFWIGDYGALNPNDQAKPRIIEVNRGFDSVLRTIELSDVLDSSANLQGVTYDSNDDCLWLAVGGTIAEIDKGGSKVRTIEIGKYAEFMSNGICYDESNDSLWVLCASRYLLHFRKDGTLLGEYPFNYSDQDHLCIDGEFLYITVGADYQGSNNYVCKVSAKDGTIIGLYRITGANALEGICIVDGELMIANDGLYHSDLKGVSYISAFDAEDFTR